MFGGGAGACAGETLGRTTEGRVSRRAALAFDRQVQLAGLPKPVGELHFHPTRRWRFDWAWPDQKLAVEVDGGLFVRGRHSRGRGSENDMEKLNEALILGWRVLRVSTDMVADGRALGFIERVFNGAQS